MKRPHFGVAWWAAVYAFAGNLIAVKVVGLLTNGTWRLGIVAVANSIIVGLAVYARERLRAARGEPPTELENR
jgi:hypothetical protein